MQLINENKILNGFMVNKKKVKQLIARPYEKNNMQWKLIQNQNVSEISWILYKKNIFAGAFSF